MRTTIDAAGRFVVPKPLREAMGMTPGRPIDITFVDGRLQIELAPIAATVDRSGRIPRIVPDEEEAPLTDDDVRSVLDGVRR